MSDLPYDQRLARRLVRPLAGLGMDPNHITGLGLALALGAAWLFAQGEPAAASWAAGLFVVARFLDHFDGELARLTGRTSRFGYYFDYVTGGLSYAALYTGVGIGLAGGPMGALAGILGIAGAVSALLALALNVELDRQLDLTNGDSVGYPALAGFELEDGIYLLAPVTWLGWLTPFFVAAGFGAILYCLWTFGRLVQARVRGQPVKKRS